MGTVHRLFLHDSLPTDPVEDALLKLLEHHRAGRLTGIAFVATVEQWGDHAETGYIANAAGVLHARPEDAREMLPGLDGRLVEIARYGGELTPPGRGDDYPDEPRH